MSLYSVSSSVLSLVDDPYHYKQYLQQITTPSLQTHNLTEEQAFRSLSESLARQSPFRPMVNSMSSQRLSFSYNPPSTMDSNGPEGSSFPSYPREEVAYLPVSNTPSVELTGAIPNLYAQAKDLHLVGSPSLLGEENSAFSPSELIHGSRHSSPHPSRHSSRHSSPHSPHCAHHCDINGVLAVSSPFPSHPVYHGTPGEWRRRVFRPRRLLLHLALPARRPLPVAQHAAAGRRSP